MQRKRLLHRAARRQLNRAVMLLKQRRIDHGSQNLLLLLAQLADGLDGDALSQLLAIIHQNRQARQRTWACVDVLVLVVDLRAKVAMGSCGNMACVAKVDAT